VAIAALFKLRRGSGVARLQRTRRLGVASGDAKSRFDSNEGDDSSAGSQTPRVAKPPRAARASSDCSPPQKAPAKAPPSIRIFWPVMKPA
jgi:hypothetical protein